MSINLVSIAAAIAIILGCRYILKIFFHKRAHSSFPPGPPALPIVGNVHQLPRECQEHRFLEWGKQYGGIVFIRLFYRPTVVINSIRIARDLMEKRSGNYSCRPPFVLLEAMGWTQVPTQLPYGERYRKHRRWMQDTFVAKDALMSYRATQQRETHILLASLLESPGAYVAHVQRHAAALVAEIVYGYHISGPQTEDAYVRLAEEAGRKTVEAGNPGANILGVLVDFFPILLRYPTWMPGAGFKVEIDEIRTLVKQLREVPYGETKAKMAAGRATSCFVTSALEKHMNDGGASELTEEEEEDVKAAASVFNAAGIDTTTSVLASFLLCMVLHPQVFLKAQAEIDAVVGRARLPDFTDREALVYLRCVMKEVYRWTVPVALGIPHRAIEDDEYEGYHIPGGAMIIPNIWGMTRNEQIYPAPEEFRPERFMEGVPDMDDPSTLVFGFGRRLCPGQHLADGNFYLIASNIIATMNIRKAVDKTGAEITPNGEFVAGFVRHPKPFPFIIEPRSEEAKVLIEHVNSLI